MDRLSKEEIKEIIDDIQRILDSRPVGIIDIGVREYSALQGLLDLYNKEKEKNKELDNMLLVNKEQYKFIKNKDNYISKDKIRDKIKELKGQEDWYIENKSLDDLYGRIDELKELLKEIK